MISVCIIAKNESENIKECLNRLRPYNYEIIVVDTGSTDDTKQIALEFTDKVYDFEWENDFSVARNFSISKASNDYVLIIDSDEYVTELDSSALEKLININSDSVGRICRTNTYWRENEQIKGTERINRLFHKSRYHYSGRIHEQIVANNGNDYNTYNVPICIDHIGYDGNEESRKKKAQRNIELLNKELHEKGEDPYVLYQLGKSYYMQQDYMIACDYFSKGLEFDINPKLEYVIDMVQTYGYALINSKQYKTALQFENIYEEFGDCAEFKFLMGLIYMNNVMFSKSLDEFFKATKYPECTMEGINSYKALYNVGVIHECLGNVNKALEYYEACGEYGRAKARIEELKK